MEINNPVCREVVSETVSEEAQVTSEKNTRVHEHVDANNTRVHEHVNAVYMAPYDMNKALHNGTDANRHRVRGEGLYKVDIGFFMLTRETFSGFRLVRP